MKKLFALLSLIPATSLATSPAQEIGTTYSKPERPLWEVGMGGIAAYGADYPGADESSFKGLAIPYVIYRGDFLRVGDGGGVRGVFVDDTNWELDVSADASFDAESDDNKARSGMPDLDFLGELGPQVKYKFISGPTQSLELRLPVRAVLSVGVDDGMEIRGQGYTFAPRLAARQSGIDTGLLPKPITVFASAGPTFATEALQEYFYEVKPQFARAGRPAYRAEGGYLGSEFTLGASTELTPRLRTFVGGNVGYYGGAANADSPLLKRDVNAGVAVGFAYSFYQSEEKAAR
jgi:outer membrane scaffolding protein for murein synthesis (MipA/OmpV family)